MFSQNQKSKKSSFIYGLIIGGAVGSVLGLLFAPAKGKDTRANIRKKLAQLFHTSAHIPSSPIPYCNDIEIAQNRHTEINVVRAINDTPKKLLWKLASWLEK